MSFIKRLFGSPGEVGKITDAVIKTGDALVFTEEEQSRANQKRLDWLLEFHEKSSGSNLARRLLAIMIVGVFLFLALLNAALIVGGVESAGDLYKFIVDALLPSVRVVVMFYFTAAIATKIEQGVKAWKR